MDFDLVNAYHQFPLAELTSKWLSVQTSWGQYEPIFLPKRVGPAAFVLQSAMDKIFGEFDDWSIVIFDNLFVLATDYDDAYKKFNRILDRCLEYNLFFKFSKTWLGFEEAKFYGYVCKRDSYELSDDRKKAIEAINPPASCKLMQTLLLADYKSRFDLPDISSDPSALLSVLLFLLDEDSSTSSDLATLFALAQDETELPSDSQEAAQTFSADEFYSQVHGGRMGHHGVRKTWYTQFLQAKSAVVLGRVLS